MANWVVLEAVYTLRILYKWNIYRCNVFSIENSTSEFQLALIFTGNSTNIENTARLPSNAAPNPINTQFYWRKINKLYLIKVKLQRIRFQSGPGHIVCSTCASATLIIWGKYKFLPFYIYINFIELWDSTVFI